MGLEDIIHGIEAQAKQKSEGFEREAAQERERIVVEAKKTAEKSGDLLLKQRTRQSEEEHQRAIIALQQEEKRKMLTLKSELMAEAFQTAHEQFLDMGAEEYRKLMMEALLASVNNDTTEILLSPRDKEILGGRFLDDLQAAISKRSEKIKPKISFCLSQEERGFITKNRDMEVNGTVSSLFSLVRGEEEIEVARLLFG